MQVHLRIQRFNPDIDVKPHYEDYDVDAAPTDRVLDALNDVKWYQDGTLTFRRSCAHGVCGSDGMRLNGRNRLACKTLIQDAGDHILVEPLVGFRVIKDLVVDMEPFMDAYKSVMPYLINDDPAPVAERYQSPEDRARFDDSTKCILCACCTSSCPITWANKDYIGPAAIVNAHRFIYDSRDQGTEERLDIMNEKNGVWRCRTVFNCTEACPRGIKVTNIIAEVKRTLLTGER